MNNTALKEAFNEVNVEGILKETNLKKTIVDGSNAIIGDITVIVNAGGTENEVKISCFAKELKKDNTASRAYTNLEGFMNNGVSVAYLMASQGMSEDEAKANASCVRAGSAKLRLNDYYREDGTLSSRDSISSNFIRVISNTECNPKAAFEVECFFSKIRKEFKSGEETGRIFVDTYIPIYGGAVIPMTFVAEGDTAEYLIDNYMPNRTGRIWGHFVSSVERVETVRQGFGKPKVDVTTTYKHELVIDGGNPEQYGEDSVNAFSPEAIQAAVQVRETEYLPNQKAKQEKNKAQSRTGFNAPGASASSGRPSFQGKW